MPFLNNKWHEKKIRSTGNKDASMLLNALKDKLMSQILTPKRSDDGDKGDDETQWEVNDGWQSHSGGFSIAT